MVDAADPPQGASCPRLRPRASRSTSPAPPGCGPTSTRPTRRRCCSSELISWPVTLVILVLAFGSLVAAGLPLMLTILGLVSSAGVLYLGTKISPISIWALNFALMFALALGIDYALFLVMRFRNALFGQGQNPVDAVAATMDTAGKAVLFSGCDGADLALDGDARAEPGLPLGGARDHGLGRLRAGGDADPAAGGAGQARPARGQARPELGPQRRAPLRRASRAGASASGGARCYSAASRWSRSWACRSPCCGSTPGCPRSRSCRRPTARARDTSGSRPPSARARRALSRSSRRRQGAEAAGAVLAADPGIAMVAPARPGSDGLALVAAVPADDPSSEAARDHRRAPPRRAARGRPRRRPRGRELRPRAGARREDAARDRRRAGPRVPAAAGRLPGAPDRGDGGAGQPAGDRRRLRRRDADLPGRPPLGPARLRVPGLPRRLGPGVLLRDDLRDRDGLHRLPALGRARALGALGRRQGGDDRRHGPLGPGDPGGGRGDGRRLLHLRPVGARCPRRRWASSSGSRSCWTPSSCACSCCRSSSASPAPRPGTCRRGSTGSSPTSASGTGRPMGPDEARGATRRSSGVGARSVGRAAGAGSFALWKDAAMTSGAAVARVKRVVILGGGSGGAVAAKRLARWSREGEVEVVAGGPQPLPRVPARATCG